MDEMAFMDGKSHAGCDLFVVYFQLHKSKSVIFCDWENVVGLPSHGVLSNGIFRNVYLNSATKNWLTNWTNLKQLGNRIENHNNT